MRTSSESKKTKHADHTCGSFAFQWSRFSPSRLCLCRLRSDLCLTFTSCSPALQMAEQQVPSSEGAPVSAPHQTADSNPPPPSNDTQVPASAPLASYPPSSMPSYGAQPTTSDPSSAQTAAAYDYNAASASASAAPSAGGEGSAAPASTDPNAASASSSSSAPAPHSAGGGAPPPGDGRSNRYRGLCPSVHKKEECWAKTSGASAFDLLRLCACLLLPLVN
jgi:hypothetical protein